MPGAPTTLMPLRERIETAAVAYRNQECLLLPDATLSFGEVDRLANATATALLGRGVREGSVVMTLCHNGAALVATWFACMKIGAVFAPLNASLSGDPLEHVIFRAGGQVLVCDGVLAGLARTAMRAIPNPPVTLVTGRPVLILIGQGRSPHASRGRKACPRGHGTVH